MGNTNVKRWTGGRGGEARRGDGRRPTQEQTRTRTRWPSRTPLPTHRLATWSQIQMQPFQCPWSSWGFAGPPCPCSCLLLGGSPPIPPPRLSSTTTCPSFYICVAHLCQPFTNVCSLTKRRLRSLKGSYSTSKGGATYLAPPDSPRPARPDSPSKFTFKITFSNYLQNSTIPPANYHKNHLFELPSKFDDSPSKLP
jgi:hypothetical protein